MTLRTPAKEELLQQFGEEYLSVQSLFEFCFVPSGRLIYLRDRTLAEEWGANQFVLLKYLAVHVRLGIEQGCYVWNGDQIVIAAGSLTTPEGVPIYVGLIPNNTPDENPWVMNWVGERPSSSELPRAPSLGDWPALEPAAEIVVACDLEGGNRRTPLHGLEGASEVAQRCAIAGAIQWALHRGLATGHLHGEGRGYFVPLYLNSRADLTEAPDLVAPITVRGSQLVARALMEPAACYAAARVCVERREQVPAWLLRAWRDAAESTRSERDEAVLLKGATQQSGEAD